jgi:hypothetical protein
VLRVPSNFYLTVTRGVRLTCKDATARLPARDRCWEVRSAGNGSKGQRWYAWAWRATASPRRYLLIRRHLITGELAFCYCYVPEGQPVSLSRLVRAAGCRWPVEVGHRWGRSSCAAFSWLCSLFLVGLVFLRCPAGAGVVAGRACPAFA